MKDTGNPVPVQTDPAHDADEGKRIGTAFVCLMTMTHIRVQIRTTIRIRWVHFSADTFAASAGSTDNAGQAADTSCQRHGDPDGGRKIDNHTLAAFDASDRRRPHCSCDGTSFEKQAPAAGTGRRKTTCSTGKEMEWQDRQTRQSGDSASDGKEQHV